MRIAKMSSTTGTYEEFISSEGSVAYGREHYEKWLIDVVKPTGEENVEFVRELEGLVLDGKKYYTLGQIRLAMEDVWRLEEEDYML